MFFMITLRLFRTFVNPATPRAYKLSLFVCLYCGHSIGHEKNPILSEIRDKIGPTDFSLKPRFYCISKPKGFQITAKAIDQVIEILWY